MSYQGLGVVFKDINTNYSGSRDCAEYIKGNIPSDALVLQTNTTNYAALSPYLGREFTAYSTDSCQAETFRSWGISHNRLESFQALLNWVNSNFSDKKEFWLIVSAPDPAEYGSSQIVSWCMEHGEKYSVFDNVGTCIYDGYAIYRIPADIQI